MITAIIAAALGSGALVTAAVGSYRALTRDTKRSAK